MKIFIFNAIAIEKAFVSNNHSPPKWGEELDFIYSITERYIFISFSIYTNQSEVVESRSGPNPHLWLKVNMKESVGWPARLDERKR